MLYPRGLAALRLYYGDIQEIEKQEAYLFENSLPYRITSEGLLAVRSQSDNR